jgi:hypothetical protein
VHICDFTNTQISSKYVHKQHTHHNENEIEFNQFENRDIPYGGTHAQGTGGSSPTHGELLEVADHSRCRKMYVVQSLEHPPRSRRPEEEEEKTSAVTRKKRAVAKTLPRNLIARTPEQMSQMQMAVPVACSPNSPCA